MKLLHVIPTLLPLTTTLALTLPPPLSILSNENPSTNKNITSRSSNVQPNIQMYLGTLKASIGPLDFNVLYNNIYTAIQHACPSSSPSSICPHPASSSFKVKTHFAADRDVSNTAAVLHIVGGSWSGSTAIYNLMVGLIAGAIERGAYAEKNCETFQTPGSGNGSYKYCNTMDWAKVELPGDKGHYLEVKLKTADGMGDYDCTAISSTVEAYVDTLKPEVERELKMTELYVEAKCWYK